MTDTRRPGRGTLVLRAVPEGLPDVSTTPPVVAESGDPFSALRVVALVAQVERGRPALVADLVDALNARYLDWLFEPRVVVDVLASLRAGWLADFGSQGGIELEEGTYGPQVTIEDAPRVDGWMVRQAQRLAAECRSILDEFSRRERPASGT